MLEGILELPYHFIIVVGINKIVIIFGQNIGRGQGEGGQAPLLRFFDQDGELIKTLTSLEIGEMGGRVIAQRQRMSKVETPDEWTEIQVVSVDYEIELKDSLFTLSNLRNPRDEYSMECLP